MDKLTAKVEHARLTELHRHAIVGTPPERTFDLIAAGAARLAHTPIALVTFVDTHRQWIKAAVGADLQNTPRDVAFCTHALASSQVLVVPDTTQDARFRDNPLVTGAPHLRFYAGAPIMTGGVVLGTVCVLDTQPRHPTDHDLQGLAQLARITANLLEHRRLGTPYATVTAGLPIAFLVVDGQGGVTRVNAAATPAPSTPWDTAGRDLTEVLPVRWSEGRHEDEIRGALARGTPWTGRVTLAAPDDAGVEAMLTVVPSRLGHSAALYVWNYQD
ncbi:PAS domain-containing protein [Deinococcus metalli]|uniref:PAS domain-containing protein n=1 Tax=Deinococcus metalli TaxID=1141878 RepID=A0A7W8NTG1_9DEIO|nr:GAF domain-containing protein [Deinococcus metalli]MBB5378142.1 PAS domain-containing protein [Deinococcus metalli]GHF56341.1 hypothetical protein GCM10017781_35820 [Deinococcus metalli]